MRHFALLAGAALALAVTGCATNRAEGTTARAPTAWDYGNPNYANTGAGGDSDMGSAGGESYQSEHASRTLAGSVPSGEEPEYYEASRRGPKDAGTSGAHDAGTY